MPRGRCRVRMCAPLLVLLGAGAFGADSARPEGDALADGFRDPPREFTQVPFWSWNGRLEPDRIREQIDRMVEQGVYGAFLHARVGLNLDSTPYFSEGWWKAVEAAVEHGARVGFATWIYDEDQWPSGAAGGRTIRANPERNTRKGLKRIERTVAGPADVPLRFAHAEHVVAGRLAEGDRIDAETLVDLTALNDPASAAIDAEPTRGLRVAVVSDWEAPRLAARCRELGCAVTELRTQQAATLQLDALDVVVSDIGTPGTTLPPETLRAWIAAGGGYLDFSHGEPSDALYALEPRVEEDDPSHRWALPAHPIATVPNPHPDSTYAGRRWSDALWKGGADPAGFEAVLVDPRFDPPAASILARTEGKGRVILCGATQACREEDGHLELLQNLLVWASRREASAPRAARGTRAEKAAWKCPAGSWLLTAYVPDTNPGTEAMPAVNYMNPATVRDFIDITYEEYARRFGEHFGKTIPGAFFDEIHNSKVEIVWVEGFAERFRELKGYDLVPFLPALSRDIGKRTPKVRCDYHDVYTRLYEEAWFRQISQWCAARGLLWTGHTVEDLGAYRTQGSYFRTIRWLQIPATDNEDFRYGYPRRIDPWKPKQLASISHLYGRPRAGVEAMGGAGWQFTLESARHGFNLLAAYGVNFFIPHLFHYAQDRPENVDDWPNSWFFRNPYWKYYKTFADHGRRLSYLLTGDDPSRSRGPWTTEHVADVAVLFPIENLWAGHGPGSTQRTVESLVAAQIDCDVIDPEKVVQAEARDGTLRTVQLRQVWPGGDVPGPSYRALVVPGVRCVSREAACAILRFAGTGGRVVVHDRFPSESSDEGRDDPEIAKVTEALRALGVEPIEPGATVERLRGLLEPDVLVDGALQGSLRYHHLRRDGREVYFVANDSTERRAGRLSVRAAGVPQLWNPEDGTIRDVTAATSVGGRTECDLALDPGQGTFLVVDTRRAPPDPGVEVRASGLEALEVVRTDASSAEVRGLLRAGAGSAEVAATLRTRGEPKEVSGRIEGASVPPALRLGGPWTFLAVGEALDREWRIDVEEAELALPTMHFRWEHEVNGRTEGWTRAEYDHSGWRRIKVQDALHADAGAHRYRTRWEACAVSWYDIAGFHTKTGGRGLRARKTHEIPAGVPSGWIAVIADGAFRLAVGDRTFDGRGGAKPETFAVEGLLPGPLAIEVLTESSRSILVEGHLGPGGGGPRVWVATDRTWECSLDGEEWRPAWEYVAPPEKPIGEPDYPVDRPIPGIAWYRDVLPPGTVAVLEPKVEGRWRCWVDGKPQLFINGEAEVEPAEGLRTICVRVRTETEDQRGLLEPVRVRCRAAPQALGSWTEIGLGGYSGRAMYETRFTAGPEHRGDGVRLFLDLGQVRWCAEAWVNGELAGTRVWPPYRLDVTDLVRPGENRLTVVVANLLANRMRWDIFHDVVGVEWNRKWHDGNIVRDAWCLESGLLGPVELIPYRDVRLELR